MRYCSPRTATARARDRAAEIFRSTTPSWTDFCIATAGTCLGAHIGPGATTTSQWATALAKLRRRTTSIASLGLSATRGFHEFGIRAVPTIGYIVQVNAPPQHLAAADRQLRTRLIHAPYNAFPPTALAHTDTLGLRRSPPLTDFAYSAMLRTAAVTASSWRDERLVLLRARHIKGDLVALAEPGREGSDMSWRTWAIVDLFFSAEAERPEHVRALTKLPHPLVPLRRYQSRVVAALRPTDPLAELASELMPRLRWWESHSPGGDHDWESARRMLLPSLRALRRTAPAFRVAAVRIWANAWVTCRRRHAGRTSV